MEYTEESVRKATLGELSYLDDDDQMHDLVSLWLYAIDESDYDEYYDFGNYRGISIMTDTYCYLECGNGIDNPLDPDQEERFLQCCLDSGIESMLEAYFEGVPVNDIIADNNWER